MLKVFEEICRENELLLSEFPIESCLPLLCDLADLTVSKYSIENIFLSKHTKNPANISSSSKLLKFVFLFKK